MKAIGAAVRRRIRGAAYMAALTACIFALWALGGLDALDD